MPIPKFSTKTDSFKLVNVISLQEFAASVKQMTEKDPMLLPKGAYSQMFDDIKLIYDVDKKFLQELEDRMKEW